MKLINAFMQKTTSETFKNESLSERIFSTVREKTQGTTSTFSSAFTLIELLVVIAIIGILSSVVLASLNGARESARDARRQQDINQIETAIQLYMNDNRGRPPLDGVNNFVDSARSDWSQLESELSSYIDPLPVDPLNEDGQPFYMYSYKAGGTYNQGDCDFNASDDDYIFHITFESSRPDLPALGNYDGVERYCIIK